MKIERISTANVYVSDEIVTKADDFINERYPDHLLRETKDRRTTVYMNGRFDIFTTTSLCYECFKFVYIPDKDKLDYIGVEGDFRR